MKLPRDGVYIDPKSGLKLTRAQRRQVRKNADKIDRVSEADRKFFRRFPQRRHRLRLAGMAELEQRVLVCGLDLQPGCQLFVIVRNIAPGHRMKVYAQLPEGLETDLPESAVKELWNAVKEFSPQVQEFEAAMRSMAGGGL